MTFTSVFISHQEASRFIKHRSKRANGFPGLELVEKGNIERECYEEVCSREEAREAFEEDETTLLTWSSLVCHKFSVF